MENISEILFLIFLTCIGSIFAFNNSLNETNTTVNYNVEVINNSENITIDVSPYKNKESKEVKFVDIKYKPNSEINSKIKTKTKKLDSNEKIYSILQFNKNPSKEEIKELKNEGIELLGYISSDTWYVSISQDLDNIFTTNDGGDVKLNSNNFNDKYLVRSLDEIKPEYKQSKYIRENKIGTWGKDENGNVYLVVQFHRDISLDKAENLMNKKGFEVVSEIGTLNTLVVKLGGGENNE